MYFEEEYEEPYFEEEYGGEYGGFEEEYSPEYGREAFLEAEEIYMPEVKAFERSRTVDIGATIGGEKMTLSEKERSLIKVIEILKELRYKEEEKYFSYHVEVEGIYGKIEKIPRLEFYNPLALILAFVFKNTRKPLSYFSTFYEATKDVYHMRVKETELLRYIRFVSNL
jgi:hypothetical protein